VKQDCLTNKYSSYFITCNRGYSHLFHKSERDVPPRGYASSGGLCFEFVTLHAKGNRLPVEVQYICCLFSQLLYFHLLTFYKHQNTASAAKRGVTSFTPVKIRQRIFFAASDWFLQQTEKSNTTWSKTFLCCNWFKGHLSIPLTWNRKNKLDTH
jgi:hypothetical protein